MMKTALVLAVWGVAAVHGAEVLRPLTDAVTRDFGVATTQAARLLKSELSPATPTGWSLFASDPYRPGEQVKLKLERVSQGALIGWKAQSAGAGQLLQRVPPLPINWSMVRLGPMEVERKAKQMAVLAKMPFTHIAYQLTTNPTSQRPEWGLVLADATLTEVGFLIIEADSGAVVHQDFQRRLPPGGGRVTKAEEEGEEAARRVKEGARQAWDWTERAGRKTGGFFRELFRPRR
jgi:hypothetical protein